MTLTLRPYQTDVTSRARGRLRTAGKRGIIQGECGSGKTVAACHIAIETRAKGNRVLVLSDRRRLVKQFGATLKEAGVPYGVIMQGESGATREPIVLASRDTFVSWIANNRDFQKPNLIITDECHRTATTLYQSIFDLYPEAFHLGLTATPARDDGKSLGDFFQWIECTVPPSQLIAEGYLIKPEVFAPLELARRRKKGEGKGLAGDPVSHWRAHADGLPTIAFASKVAEAQALADRFSQAGIPAEAIAADVSDEPWGMDRKSDRDRVYDRLADGRLKVLCSVGLLVEGVDIPEVSAAIVWCKCGSVVKWRQLSGRTMRPCPRIGKDRAIILDHSGAAGVHGLPGDDVEWSLDLASTVAARREKAIEEGRQKATVICRSCGLAYQSAPACPSCGKAAPRAEKKRSLAEQYEATTDAILERFSPDEARDLIRERRQREWVRCIAIAVNRGAPAGAAVIMFRKTCKVPPWEAGVGPLPEGRGDWRRSAREVWPQFVRQGV